MKRLFVLCAFVLSAIAAPASAAIIFNVNGLFTAQGTSNPLGTLTGTFTTNDAVTQIIGIDLTSSFDGAFQGFNYNNVSMVDSQGLPTTFRLTVSLPGHTNQLQLAFSPALTASGGTIGGNSFEHQDFTGSGNRILSGTVTAMAAAVPEPATWLMMIAGFGLAGAALRARRRAAVAA